MKTSPLNIGDLLQKMFERNVPDKFKAGAMQCDQPFLQLFAGQQHVKDTW